VVRRTGGAAATLLVGLIGVLVGAGLVWMLVSKQIAGAGGAPGTPGEVPARQVSTSSENAIVSAVRNVGPAVVKVSTEIRPTESEAQKMLRQFFRLPQPFPKEGEGSGVIIDGDKGYVLTNAHVVRGASKVSVTLSDKRQLDARVVGADPLSDIAVVQIKSSKLPVARLGSIRSTPIGSWVIAIGNPFGFDNSVTVGVISAVGRRIPEPDGAVLDDLIQTDASINPGNSGGALVNLSGEVIGIPTAIIPQAQGLGFAIAIDSARAVFEKLIKTGSMPWLGVAHHFLSAPEAQKLKVPGGKGAVVVQVVPNGPADQAGIRPGDVILRFDGKPADTEHALGNAIRQRNAGDKVDAMVLRDGREMKITVKLGAVPQEGIGQRARG
jgi:serine protease Do